MGALGLETIGHKVAVSFVRLYKALESMLIVLFSRQAEGIVRRVYKRGDVKFNGSNPWDIQVHNKKEFFSRVASNAPMGLGESYMDGVWDCDDICELTRRTMRFKIYKAYLSKWNRFLNFLELHLFNLQTKAKAWEVGQKHYDTGMNFPAPIF